ncbi:TetR/AcrR family transcriptional regulator [Mycobacterium sp. DL592]|uniref:TetR/AcrR family transcriptional regulator n=1 Tax=Mycobacterium sp. DL592 TaxID=2675524 RepID=UPI00141F5792|nr:TetR/AcrR family transcriptional regulator [Mycobacterium sp. DL592]
MIGEEWSDMAQKVRSRNKRGEGDQLRTEIISAAADLIDTGDDVRALTLRGVARRAGVSAPSIYPHFGDLEAVLDAVREGGFAELDASVEQAMAGASAPDERLIAGCLAYVRYGWRHPRRYRFMIAADGFAANAVDTFHRVEQALRECADAGLSTSLDTHTDAFLLWVGMHGMATLEKPDRAALRRLGPLDRVALTATLARRLGRLAG